MKIDEIAKLANVSKTTISFYLNNKTHKMSRATYEKIKQIIQENNYVPEENAQRLRTKKSNDIGIVVGNINQEFTINLFQSLQNELQIDNFNISLFESNLDLAREKTILIDLLKRKVRAIILQPSIALENQLSSIIAKWKHSNSQIILIDPKDTSNLYISHQREYYSSIEQVINKNYNFNKVIFICEEINKLAVRQLRQKAIFKIASKINLDFELWELKAKNHQTDLNKFLSRASLEIKKTLFFANNAENLLNFLAAFKQTKITEDLLNIATFNKCIFGFLTNAKIKTIITNTHLMGTLIAKQIINNQYDDHKIPTYLEI